MAELEANRIEEIASGGYIPPESEIVAEGYDIEVEKFVLIFWFHYAKSI